MWIWGFCGKDIYVYECTDFQCEEARCENTRPIFDVHIT